MFPLSFLILVFESYLSPFFLVRNFVNFLDLFKDPTFDFVDFSPLFFNSLFHLLPPLSLLFTSFFSYIFKILVFTLGIIVNIFIYTNLVWIAIKLMLMLYKKLCFCIDMVSIPHLLSQNISVFAVSISLGLQLLKYAFVF